MPKLGKDSAWDFFDERLETYTGGAQKEKSRSFCRCTFCGQEWVFRNLYQLQLHLANPIEVQINCRGLTACCSQYLNFKFGNIF